MRSMLASSLRGIGHTICIETPIPRALIDHVQNDSVDVAILDLHLGRGPTGADLAVALRRLQPQIGLVILSSYLDPRLLRSDLPSLPVGTRYLNKAAVTSVDVLERAIEDSLDLGAGSVTSNASVQSANPLGQLSDSQLEVLKLLSQGLSNHEIAKRRFTTEKAVEISIARTSKTLKIERSQSHNQRINMAKAYFRAQGMKLDEDE